MVTSRFFQFSRFSKIQKYLADSKMDKNKCPFFVRPKKSWKNEKMEKSL
jgi:hypothetical protein